MLASYFFQAIGEFIKNEYVNLVSTLVVGVFCISGIAMTSVWSRKYIEKNARRKHAVSAVKGIVNVIRGFSAVLTLLIIIGIWIDYRILIGIGVVTIAFAACVHKTAADIISGLFIVLGNYYDPEETIEVSGFKGVVKEIRLKTTKLINARNETMIIANSRIGEVINYSREPSVGIVDITVDPKTDLHRVIRLLEDNLVSVKEQFGQIVEGPNVIGLFDLTDKGTVIRITVKTLPERHYDVQRYLRKYIGEITERNGIRCLFIS